MMWVVICKEAAAGEDWFRNEGRTVWCQGGPCKAGETADLGHDLVGECENQLSIEKRNAAVWHVCQARILCPSFSVQG